MVSFKDFSTIVVMANAIHVFYFELVEILLLWIFPTLKNIRISQALLYCHFNSLIPLNTFFVLYRRFSLPTYDDIYKKPNNVSAVKAL